MVVETVGRAFQLTKDNIAQLLPAALVLSSPHFIATFGDPNPFDNHTPPVALFASLIGNLSGVLLSGVIAHFVFQKLQNREISMQQSIGLVFPRFLALLGTGILAGLAIAGAGLLLVVPAFIVAVGLSVVVPVVVIEHVSGTRALRRAWDLTRGYKWPVFGMFVLACLPLFVISAGLGISFALAVEVSAPSRAAAVAYMSTMLAIGVLWNAFFGALVVVVYHHLRMIQDGGRDFPTASVPA